MNKRLILKYKVCRRYEEDIWGIFYRKQQRRDYFFKSLGLLLFKRKNPYIKFRFFRARKDIRATKKNIQNIRYLLFSKYLDKTNLNNKNFFLKNINLKNFSYLKTEYFLTYFFGIRIRQFFYRNRFSVKKLNHIMAGKIKPKHRIGKRKRKARIYTLQEKILSRKKLNVKGSNRNNFTLDLIPKNNLKRSNKGFKSIYHKRMSKVWLFRKFYGCLTNSQLKRICLESYRKRGDIVSNFMISLESRIDTVLYRTGMVSSIFEARQLISHKKILVNNEIVNIRSYTLKNSDILSLSPVIMDKTKNNMLNRIHNKSIMFYNIYYIETNYKLLCSLFVPKLLKVDEIPYNFEFSDKDINNILYYYY